MRTVSLFVGLLIVWLLLSGYWNDPLLVACGIFSCVLATSLAVRLKVLDAEGLPLGLALRLLPYLPWLLWQIVLANLDVAKRVWKPRLDISPRFVRVPYHTKTAVGTVMYAQSITLTPGTVTVFVDVDNESLLVHCLTETAERSLLTGEMHERVQKLER